MEYTNAGGWESSELLGAVPQQRPLAARATSKSWSNWSEIFFSFELRAVTLRACAKTYAHCQRMRLAFTFTVDNVRKGESKCG